MTNATILIMGLNFSYTPPPNIVNPNKTTFNPLLLKNSKITKPSFQLTFRDMVFNDVGIIIYYNRTQDIARISFDECTINW